MKNVLNYFCEESNAESLILINFMSIEKLQGQVRAKGKIRYSHGGADCTIRMIDGKTLECTFDEPQRAVTPGQALVLYDGEYVLGGGVII